MKRYNKYKPSGIEWLSEIPEHWDVKRVKDVFNSLDYRRIPLSGEIRNEIKEGEYDYYGASGVIDKIDKYIFNDELLLIGEDGANLLTRTKPLAFIAKGKFWVNNHAHILKPKFWGNIKYLTNTLESLDYSMWVTGSAQPKLTQENLNNIFLYYPSTSEQTAIANYLDTKTTAIDRKIELLTAKVDKYKALRRSLINETVCRGLNPNAPLKDSGIEWIGKIPEHWEVKRVKDIFTYTTGNTPDSKNESYYEGNNTWICIGDISEDKYISDSKMKISDKAINDLNMIKTPKGSLLYSFKLSIGKMAFVEQDVYTNEAILSIFPNKRISLHFIYYMLPYFLELAATENIYGAKMLNQKIIANALLVVPKLEEQIQIASYLDSKTTQIDTILTNISNQISKLTQLRKTLINDVVTGKIKVTD